jgi:DNA-binding NarL/FixJ family response regulator
VSVKVVLVDDQALIRTGLKMILESEDDIEIVGEACDGEQAISVARSVQPDVVLMDVQMPTMDGIEATGRIAQDASIPSRIVILTTFERDDYVFEALRAGASGFLLKNSPSEELVHAVRVVAGGDALLAPSITRKVIEGFIRRPAHLSNEIELGRLTERETEILRLLATGKSNSELAAHLFVGEGTIKTHVSNVLTKLGLRDRMQAVIFAYESGLIEPGQHRE